MKEDQRLYHVIVENERGSDRRALMLKVDEPGQVNISEREYSAAVLLIADLCVRKKIQEKRDTVPFAVPVVRSSWHEHKHSSSSPPSLRGRRRRRRRTRTVYFPPRSIWIFRNDATPAT